MKRYRIQYHGMYGILAGMACVLLAAGCYRYSGEIDPSLFDLRITEIQYHPLPDGEVSENSLEFIELKNTGNATVDLSTCSFTEGISYVFQRGSHIAAGGFYVIASNGDGFTRRYGFAPDGVYDGKLSNSADTLVLTDDYTEEVVLSQPYADGNGWPEAADGDGYSLVPVKSVRSRNQNDPAVWRRSFALHGSPFADDPGVVLVNEVISNAVGGDAIELYNPGDAPVDVSGWFLTDRRSDPLRYAIPEGTIIPAGGYRVVTEEDITTGASVINPFSLSSHGDDVYVMAAGGGCDSGYCHGFEFDAAEFDRSIGRYVTSIGKEVFVPQKAISLEEKNEGPLIGPVIVSELLLHSTDNRGDFIEVTNIELREIRLYDPENQKNTWKIDGIDFSFPEGVSVKSGESVIIASNALSETDFRDRYSVGAATCIIFLSDTLPDDDVTLTLMKPEAPFVKDSLESTVPEVPFVYVDRIEYHSSQSWPSGLKGTGRSLHRISDSSFGDDPASWVAGDPDPGKRSW